jgi:hypothetical protein
LVSLILSFLLFVLRSFFLFSSNIFHPNRCRCRRLLLHSHPVGLPWTSDQPVAETTVHKLRHENLSATQGPLVSVHKYIQQRSGTLCEIWGHILDVVRIFPLSKP